MIKLKDITVRIAGRTLIENLTLTLNEGHRYGLVGRNGTGKSTFFKVLLQTLHQDEGQLEIPSRIRIGHVAQEAPAGETTPLRFRASPPTLPLPLFTCTFIRDVIYCLLANIYMNSGNNLCVFSTESGQLS